MKTRTALSGLLLVSAGAFACGSEVAENAGDLSDSTDDSGSATPGKKKKPAASDGSPVTLDAADDPAVEEVDASVPLRCDPAKPFGAPAPLAEFTAEPGSYMFPWLTADETRVLFTRSGGGSGLELFTATRASRDQPFGAGKPFDLVVTSTDEYVGSLSEDGLELFYVRSGNSATRTTRAKASDTFPVGSTVQLGGSSTLVVTPRRSRSGAVYYLGWSEKDKTVRLYSDLGATIKALALDFNGSVDAYSLSVDERTLYFSGQPAVEGGAGATTVYRATRPTLSQPFTTATVVAELSGIGFAPNWISEDECIAYGDQRPPSGDRKIYTAKRAK